LYADDTDLFVAGLCCGFSRVGIFSCFRYQPKLKYSEEFWYDAKLESKTKSKSSDSPEATSKKDMDNLLVSRSCKLLVHETCHLVGMGHCVFMDCCMNGSGNLAEDFRQSMFLCPIDLRKLAHILKFDPIERYKKMRHFFLKFNSKKEIDWLNDVIETFQSKDKL
jgi:archaemetzincin